MQNIIGIDLSIKCPAVTVLTSDNKLKHFIFPRIGEHKTSFIDSLKLADVTVVEIPNIKLIKDSTLRERQNSSDANYLTYTICNTIAPYIADNPIFVIEGLSFKSGGDIGITYGGYHYILRQTIHQYFNVSFDNMFIYAPLSVKSIVRKLYPIQDFKGSYKKEQMIDAFINFEDDILQTSTFRNSLEDIPEIYQKKTGTWQKIDDIIDSYWVLKTHMEKQN